MATLDPPVGAIPAAAEPVAAPTTQSTSEQRLRALTASSADMLALYDLDGIYLEVSPASRTLFGWEPEELVGTSSYEYFHPDDLEVVSAAHGSVLDSDQVGPVVYRLRCADGSYRWVEVLGRSLRDPGTGELTAIQCTTRDVTARREAELTRDATEARLRTTLEHAPIGMALVGLDGRALEANEALCEILQRPVEQLVGASIAEVTHPDDLDADLALLGEVLRGEQSHYALTKRYLRPDGTAVPCELHVSVLRDDRDDPTALIAQVVDVTAREAAEAELQATNAALSRSNEELERFAAVASHDLRGPLSTARSLLEFLGSRVALPDGSLEADVYERACAQLDRLGETVNGLLDLALLGNRRLETGEIPLGELLGEVLDGLEFDDGSPPGDVRLSADAQLTGDRRLLLVLLQNLISNARNSAGDERTVNIEVSGHRDEAEWRLSVEDDGDGVPPGLREQLFRPAHSQPVTQVGRGHGFGLATCQRIVERHGGSIRVEHLPTGTVFHVAVPVADAP